MASVDTSEKIHLNNAYTKKQLKYNPSICTDNCEYLHSYIKYAIKKLVMSCKDESKKYY